MKNKKPRRRSSPTKSPPSTAPITELKHHLEVFAQAVASGMRQKDAAAKCGRSRGSAQWLKDSPGVRQRISEIREQFARETTSLRAQKVVKEITIDRNDIIMGLADIAKTGESERARVAAWLGLSDIFMLRAKNTRDLKEFYGWTTDELRDYAVNGTVPERLRLLVGEGEGAGLGGTPSLRGEKKPGN